MEQRQRNLLLGGVGLAALAIAAILLVTRSGGSTAMPKSYTVRGVCLACYKESDVTRPLGEYPPFKCPSCGKPAVYTVFYCLDCNKRFVPDLDRPAAAGPLRLPMGARCRACGSGHVCQYVAALADQKPVGDAPWPKWQE